MRLVFTCMLGESYRRQLGALLYSCVVSGELLTPFFFLVEYSSF